MKELSEDQIWKMLEGHTNVLAPLAKQQESDLKRASCPNCGQGGCTPELNTKRPFVLGSPLPNFMLHCENCQITFDPYSKLITNAPASILDQD